MSDSESADWGNILFWIFIAAIAIGGVLLALKNLFNP